MVVEISLTKKCYGRTDGRTEGTTDRCKPVYLPLFQSRGIKKQKGYLFDFNVKVCSVFSFCSEYTEHTIINIKRKSPEMIPNTVELKWLEH